MKHPPHSQSVYRDHRFLRRGRGVYRYIVANRGFRWGLNRVDRVMGVYVVVGRFAYCAKWR